jgi:hypothetical protein
MAKIKFCILRENILLCRILVRGAAFFTEEYDEKTEIGLGNVVDLPLRWVFCVCLNGLR